MLRTAPILFLALLLGAPAASAAPAGEVRVELLVDGRLAREYRRSDTTYIEARKNKEYSIRLSNDSGRRVAVALAVDGLNTIDAKRSSAADAAKWVLGPWEQITVTGWQVSSQHARRFVFTTEQKSYGAWLGKTSDLGVIEAVVFAEKVRCCAEPAPWTSAPEGEWDGALDYERRERRAPRGGAGKSSAEASAPESPRASSAAGDIAGSSPSRRKADDYAATGTGQRVRNEVQWTAMELERKASGTARLRYGWKDELIALGVLPEPDPYQDLRRREQASGFAPDPGSACCR